MIALLAGTAIQLVAMQASISAPTDAFRGCLREAASKAKTDKVPGDGIEVYLKTACTGQMGTLKDDYVSTPADNYKFMAQMNAPKSAPAAAATPAPTPAAVTQPPKP